MIGPIRAHCKARKRSDGPTVQRGQRKRNLTIAVLPRRHIEYPAGHGRNPAIAASAMISSKAPVPLRPFADRMPSSARCPRRALFSIVRWRTSSCRARCSIKAACCSFVLIETNRRWPRHRLVDRRRIDGRYAVFDLAARKRSLSADPGRNRAQPAGAAPYRAHPSKNWSKMPLYHA